MTDATKTMKNIWWVTDDNGVCMNLMVHEAVDELHEDNKRERSGQWGPAIYGHALRGRRSYRRNALVLACVVFRGIILSVDLARYNEAYIALKRSRQCESQLETHGIVIRNELSSKFMKGIRWGVSISIIDRWTNHTIHPIKCTCTILIASELILEGNERRRHRVTYNNDTCVVGCICRWGY